MKSNTYYGEYTLKHWIKLLITRNITLPDYQRSFVWETKDIRQLIKSISEGQFIQPVTIARYSDGINPPTNLILDGQQRLTSILISYLCKIPDRTRFNNSEVFAGEDDSANDEQDDDVTKLPMGWTFLDMLNNFSIDGNP